MASVAASSDEVGAGGGSGSSAASDSKLKALREDLMLKAQLAQVQYTRGVVRGRSLCCAYAAGVLLFVGGLSCGPCVVQKAER